MEVRQIPTGDTSEMTLVVEDDPDVRASSAEVLRELGYSVTEAADGPAALRLLEGESRVGCCSPMWVFPAASTGASWLMKRFADFRS